MTLENQAVMAPRQRVMPARLVLVTRIPAVIIQSHKRLYAAGAGSQLLLAYIKKYNLEVPYLNVS